VRSAQIPSRSSVSGLTDGGAAPGPAAGWRGQAGQDVAQVGLGGHERVEHDGHAEADEGTEGQRELQGGHRAPARASGPRKRGSGVAFGHLAHPQQPAGVGDQQEHQHDLSDGGCVGRDVVAGEGEDEQDPRENR
jgi:hypothetical protein